MELFRPGKWSISIRLSLWYSSTILVILTGFAVLTYINFHQSLHRDFDQHLNHEHRILESQITLENEEFGFTRPELIQVAAYATEGVYGTYVRLIDEKGMVVFESPNMDSHEELAVALPNGSQMTEMSRIWDDLPVRTHYFPLLRSSGSVRGWLEVSGFEWSLHQELGRLWRTFAVGILVTSLLALLGGFMLARRALIPVKRITETANKIDLFKLDLRIPVREDVKDELTDLSETLNRLLERIHNSILRERRFSANAAHELVTPLATLRAEIELTIRAKNTPKDISEVLERSIGDIDRIENVVRSLLLLSSAERTSDKVFERVNVSEMCRDHLGRFSDRAIADGIELSSRIEDGLHINGNIEGLGNVLDNLLDNAFKYTPTNGEVVVSAGIYGAEVVIEVCDNGIGFSPSIQEHLFDRFFRAKSTSVQTQPGSGLGLSIAAATAQAMRGRVVAESDGEDQGSRFLACFPID